MLLRSFVQAYRVLGPSERLRFGLLLCARLLVQGLDLLGIAAIGFLVAALAGSVGGNPVLSLAEFAIDVSDSDAIVSSVLVIASFFIGKSIAGAVFLRVTTGFLGRLEASLAIQIAEFIFQGSGNRVRNLSSGEIQWAVLNSPQVGFSIILLAGSTVITEGMLFLLVIAGFLLVDFLSGLLVVAYFGFLVAGFQWFVGKRIRRLGERVAFASSEASDSVLDLAKAYREVSVLERRGFFLGRFSHSRTTIAMNTSLQRFVLGLPRYFVETALITGVVALVLGNYLLGSLSESLAVIAIFLAGGTRLMAALLPLQNALAEIKMAAPKAKRALQLIHESHEWHREREHDAGPSPSMSIRASNQESGTAGLSISVSSLGFNYSQSAESALTGIDFKCEPGEFVAVVGPSGAGKTTLADLLLGVLDPTRGEILLSGVPPRYWRRVAPGTISYVPQNPGVVKGSLAENVALDHDLNRESLARVEECLELAGLSQFCKSLEEGLGTRVGSGELGLSGGQVQRLGIARALFRSPRLLVLDEATSALDAETENEIAKTITTLRGEVTLVVIAHRLSTVQFADSVALLEGGRLEGFGTFAELRRTKPFIARSLDLLRIDSAG